MKSQWIAAVVVLAVVVGRTADATDGEVRVQDRNRCRGHATVLATLEGHGSENRSMPDGSVSLRKHPPRLRPACPRYTCGHCQRRAWIVRPQTCSLDSIADQVAPDVDPYCSNRR